MSADRLRQSESVGENAQRNECDSSELHGCAARVVIELSW